MFCSGYFKNVFALLLVSGSLFGMDKTASEKGQAESLSGSAGNVRAKAVRFADEFQTPEEADDFRAAVAASLQGAQTDVKKRCDGKTDSPRVRSALNTHQQSGKLAYPRRYWRNDGKYADAYRRPDGTIVLDCSHWEIEENPRFVAQERFFKRLDQIKAHHALAQALWKAHPASDAEVAEAEKQLKEITAIREGFSKENVIRDLKALRAIKATKVQLPFFAEDGFIEYQTPAQTLGKTVVQMLNTLTITNDPKDTQTLHQKTQDLNFDVRSVHAVIDKMVDNLKVLEQRTTISKLFERLRKPGSSFEEWIEICVSLRSINPSKTPLLLQDPNGQITHFTITQVLGEILQHIMRSLGHQKSQTLVLEDNSIKQGFDKAIQLLQAKQQEMLKQVDADEKARHEAIKQQQQKQAEDADPLLAAVKKFNHDPSEFNQTALLGAKVSQSYKDNADTDFLLEKIKEHIANNNIAKAQACCTEFIQCTEEA